jgi:hypothetical protein
MFLSGLAKRLSIGMLLLSVLLAACAAPAAGPDETATETPLTPGTGGQDTATGVPPPPTLPPAEQETISTVGVEVAPGSHIRFEGRSTLPDGTRLETEFSADDAPVSWWPEETAVEVQGGRWQIRVPLGGEGAPEELPADKQYVLLVWERSNPEVRAAPFPFDLSGPAAPPPETGTETGMSDVEEIDILLMESFPIQVAVVAKGTLRDACTEIDKVRRHFDAGGNTFSVEITTVRDPDEVCAQVLTPFEERFSLDVYGLPAGTYTVDVNGVTGTFTFDVDNAPPGEPSGADISWEEARELILAGEVEQVTQLHSLQVTLNLKDGRRLVTFEPEIDDVFGVVAECGEPCSDMVLATE